MMAILAMAAAVAASSPDEVAARNSADLQVLYEQSCKVRAYGSYDDMCSTLRTRIKEFDRDQAREARERRQAGPVRQATTKPPSPKPGPVETPTSQPAAAFAPVGH